MMYNSAKPQKIINWNDKLLIILDCSSATGKLCGTMEGIIFYNICGFNMEDVYCISNMSLEKAGYTKDPRAIRSIGQYNI